MASVTRGPTVLETTPQAPPRIITRVGLGAGRSSSPPFSLPVGLGAGRPTARTKNNRKIKSRHPTQRAWSWGRGAARAAAAASQEIIFALSHAPLSLNPCKPGFDIGNTAGTKKYQKKKVTPQAPPHTARVVLVRGVARAATASKNICAPSRSLSLSLSLSSHAL